MYNVAFFLLFSVSTFAAPHPNEILLWPNGAPGSEGKAADAVVKISQGGEESVTGVHKPSITPYLPAPEKATGAAVLVIPGGGHRVLAITHEGYNVAEWLRDRGIAAFVLKYRLARETNSTYKLEVHPMEDTRRAIRLIRSRASEWHVNPEHIGAIGFSAGGELVAWTAMKPEDARGDASDEIDKQSARLDFQALIYPGSSQTIQPTKGGVPAFLACAYNDRPDIGEGLAEVYLRFKRVGVPTELHIYATGGHGFGLREKDKRPVAGSSQRFVDWMADSGFVTGPSGVGH